MCPMKQAIQAGRSLGREGIRLVAAYLCVAKFSATYFSVLVVRSLPSAALVNGAEENFALIVHMWYAQTLRVE